MLNAHLLYRSRWGGDRICPNAPDEGTRLARVRVSKFDFSRPKGGFAPIRGWYFLVCLH